MQRIATLLICLLLGACAQTPKQKLGDELVVVLPGHDGKVGGVVVRRDGAEQVLDQAYAGSKVSAEGKQTAAKLSAAEIHQTFGTTLAALPPKPASFLLYFLEGRDELTPASSAEMKNVLEEIKRRPEPDLLVIGHTDSVGGEGFNDKLSIARAERIRDLLTRLGIAAERIQVTGRGKREALVQTANNVPEPRNRRVEISVR